MDIYAIREDIKRNNKSLSDVNLRVVYYARVSTDKDAQLHSLSAQQKHFEELISKNKNWDFIRSYID